MILAQPKTQNKFHHRVISHIYIKQQITISRIDTKSQLNILIIHNHDTKLNAELYVIVVQKHEQTYTN